MPLLAQAFGRKKNQKIDRFSVLVFFALVLPITLVILLGYRQASHTITDSAMKERQQIARNAAALLQERFDRLIDLGSSFALRVNFRKLVSQGRWEEAVQIFQEDIEQFPFITRIFLTDTNGVLHADVPHIEGVAGRDFSFRDWYTGISSNWQPFVSKVYRRTAEPQYNVITFVTPIKLEDTVIGILAMQVRAKQLLEWSLEFGVSHPVYIVDHFGQIAAHPGYNARDDIVSYETYEYVQELLKGNEGSFMATDTLLQQEVDASYAPVPRYGWGIVTYQTMHDAAKTHFKLLASLRLQYGGFFVMSVIFALCVVVLLRALGISNVSRDESDRRLRSIIDNAPAVIYMKDVNGKYLLINNKYEKLFKVTSKKIRHKTDYDIFPKDMADAFRANDLAVIQTRSPLQVVEAAPQKDGIHQYLSSKFPILDKNGDIFAVAGISTDITEEKKLERAKNEFVSMCSHQLRTPLSTMRWIMEILLESPQQFSQTQQQMLQSASTATKHMIQSVETMLLTTKVEAGSLQKNSQCVSVRSMLQSVCKEISMQKPEITNIVLDTIPAALCVYADPFIVKEVFLNLLSNAVKYNTKHQKIVIQATLCKNTIRITIEDRGIGIPVTDQKHIGEKLYRGTNAKAMEFNSSGLGMYVVTLLLPYTQGRVFFCSEENKGSTFVVLFPLHKHTS